MSASVETRLVLPECIDEMWPHVAGWLQSAAERCGDWTIEGLRRALVRQELLLWVLWDGERLRAAAITEALIVPRGKICRIVACGGESVGAFQPAIDAIERYAKSLGCVAMRIEGREGWRRALPSYRLEWVCIEKELN